MIHLTRASHGLYLAVGNAGLLATSTDAENWTVHDSGITNDLTSIAVGNGVFLAISTGAVYRSTTGSSWTQQELPNSPPLGKVAFGNGVFLIPDSADGNLWSSPDGLAWDKFSLPNNLWIAAVSFWQDRFIGQDARGNYLVSTNGLLWSQLWEHRIGFEERMIGYQDGLYVLVGGSYYSTCRSMLFTSADGIDWEPHQAREPLPLNSVAFGNNTIVVAMFPHGILQSAPLSDMAPQLAIPPESVALPAGGMGSLTATAISSQPVSYQWYMDGVPISNPNESILVLTNLAVGERHEYSVVISNALGSATSPPARVVFGVPARLTMQNGPEAQFNLEGTAGLVYQVECLNGQIAPYGWQVLTNIALSGSVATAKDPLPPGTQRFYRAKLIP